MNLPQLRIWQVWQQLLRTIHARKGHQTLILNSSKK
jgi:hypothetical protein